MTEELKPCPNPWCTSNRAPIVPFTTDDVWRRDGRFRVQCPDCPIVGPHAQTEDAAIRLWNIGRRPEPAMTDQDKELIDRINHMLLASPLDEDTTMIAVEPDDLREIRDRLEARASTQGNPNG